MISFTPKSWTQLQHCENWGGGNFGEQDQGILDFENIVYFTQLM